MFVKFFFFFFQAEDGIRDADVTGVQTCALPISAALAHVSGSPTRRSASPNAASISGLAKGAEVIEVIVNWGCTSSSRCAIVLASSTRPRLARAAARSQ